MGTINPNLPLALRAWPTEDKDANSIQTLISRISQQHRHARHVTEKGLLEEIANKTANNNEEEEVSEDDGVETLTEPTTKNLEELYKDKSELFQYCLTAREHAAYALDLISLLISKKSKTGEQTVSPALKEAAGLGTLGYDKWQNTQTNPQTQELEDLIATGQRAKSLNTAADTLLKAATRLEKEVRRETTYWEEILSISEKGWSVRRVPRQRLTLGVQYGFLEAINQFRSRGFAVLRSNESGNIELDQGMLQKPKGLRIRVTTSDGKVVGTSKPPLVSNMAELSLEDHIHKARDSIFEEELFHELMLEARVLTGYHVNLREQTIHANIALSEASALKADPSLVSGFLIDLVTLDEDLMQTKKRPSDNLAQKIALALRVLLCYNHRWRLRKRSGIPPPLSDKPQNTPAPPILRPVLSYFHYTSAVSNLRDYVHKVSKSLRSAGLELEYSLKQDTNLSNLSKTIASNANDTRSEVENLTSILINPLQYSITLDLGSLKVNNTSDQALVIESLGQLYPPIWGTQYAVIVTPALSSILGYENNRSGSVRYELTSFSKAITHIDHMLAVFIAHAIIAPDFEGVREIDKSAELIKTTSGVKQSSRFRINVKNGSLSLYWRRASALKHPEEIIWDGERAEKGLKEVMEEMLMKEE
ncbi:hypothetical protein M501DRAFT_985724 [Patellaria atrata CBS 101060]|uniref:Mediator of RNA polymerase II transcription subunit 17 n=1 Tax=Patellaria atrata CBS 101060 TaxID=1346257 RepID=A0A9P4SJB4_9PEZI|nr:hypothetical protein M501DRAFT_985724 [Patellaria atrata CBS 101060]